MKLTVRHDLLAWHTLVLDESGAVVRTLDWRYQASAYAGMAYAEGWVAGWNEAGEG